ncbi:MAG: GYD domain superfamily, partial [Candidatus Rokuibacteriota bacterium]
MALYIMLSTLSERGRQVLKKLPGSIRKVNQEVGRMGVRVIAQYAVLGPYDFVTVIEAPDNEAVAKVSMELGARGSLQMMTMPAIPVDTFIARLAGRGSG